jgi:hypothetical protein
MNTKEKRNAGNLNEKETDKDKALLEGYPVSPSGEDIYNKYFEEKEINPEDISRTKESDREAITFASKVKDGSLISENDLDVPGSELDDNQEDIGSEDEENNYYSLGSDKNAELEEDHGEL